MRKVISFIIILILCSLPSFSEDVWWIKIDSVGPFKVSQTSIDQVRKYVRCKTSSLEDLQRACMEKYGLKLFFDEGRVSSILVTKYQCEGKVFRTPQGVHIYSKLPELRKGIKLEYNKDAPTCMEIMGCTKFITLFEKENFITYIYKGHCRDGRVIGIWLGKKSDYKKYKWNLLSTFSKGVYR